MTDSPTAEPVADQGPDRGGCTCDDWKQNIELISGPMKLHAARTGGRGYEGKFISYCPWCGKRLPVDSQFKVGQKLWRKAATSRWWYGYHNEPVPCVVVSVAAKRVRVKFIDLRHNNCEVYMYLDPRFLEPRDE